MSVVMHQEGLRHLLRDPIGPTGLFIDAKAREVNVRAIQNASTVRPAVRSQQLITTIRYSGLEFDRDGLVAYIGTDAFSPRQHFPYPLALELGVPNAFPAPRNQPGQSYRYPWLRPALEDTFPGSV